MSRVRNPKLSRTKASNRNQGPSQRRLPPATLLPQFSRHGLQLYGFLQHRVVAVPLHEIRASHEGPVFGGASVVMPEVEEHKINRIGKWWTTDGAIGTQTIH